jgi:OmpA-OmpF porin, OOP family
MQLVKVAIGVAIFSGVAVWPPALADEGDWYVGLGGGRSQSRLDDDRLARELSAPGFSPDTVSWDNHGDAYKAFAGYQFFKYFTLEGSYFDLGKFSFVAPTSPSGSLDGQLRVRGIGFDALGILPFTEKFSAFAKLGASYAQTRDSFSAAPANTVANPSPREWRANPKGGVGLQYSFSLCAVSGSGIALPTASATVATSTPGSSVSYSHSDITPSRYRRRRLRRRPWLRPLPRQSLNLRHPPGA